MDANNAWFSDLLNIPITNLQAKGNVAINDLDENIKDVVF